MPSTRNGEVPASSGDVLTAANGRAPRRTSPGWRLLFGLLTVAAVASCSGSGSSADHASWSPSPSASPSALLTAALAAEKNGDTATATADLQQLLRLDPHDVAARYDLGDLAQTAGRDAEAEADYRQVLVDSPAYVPALFNLAILLTPSDPTEALSLYARAVTAAPGNAEVHLNDGFLLLARGMTAAGRAQLSTAVSLDPSLRSRVPAGDLPSTPSSAVTP